MPSTKCLGLVFSLVFICCVGEARAAEPRVLIDGAKLELVASEPDIVTPVGMTFDSQGRLLVIESHTHQRPGDYQGPPGDRIRMLSDTDGDGQLETWSTFAEGFQQSMNVMAAVPGRVYLVTRRSVDLLIDETGDGRMDRIEPVLRLETKENYPHNALSGIAFDGNGGLFIGIGENFGAPYKLIGTDGSLHADHGGVGTIFRCTADGKNLHRFCNGFWNPFSICRLPSGAVFMVDNDPDSSPPCRLIHAVETGDYGYRFEYSRAGIHPLQAWDGELPGTLPMLAGTGEAPCAVIPHRGFLWVTSWGDHRVERYRLKPHGASFAAEQEIAVQGDTFFRPTGCAVAPDGSLYFADWVDVSYPVHGRGRIWRLSFGNESSETFPKPGPLVDAAADPLTALDRYQNCRQSNDLFLRQAAVRTWQAAKERWPDQLSMESAADYLLMLQAMRWNAPAGDATEKLLQEALQHESTDVRLYAVRWIADERMQSLRDDVEALLEGDIPDERFYLAVLAALEWLDGEPKLRSRSLNDGLLVRELKKASRSAQLHAFALRLVSPDNKYLTLDRLRSYLKSDHQPLRLEAVRTLGLQSNPDRLAMLAEVAQDQRQADGVRATAVSGLAATDDYAEFLAALADDSSDVVRQEALRVQRLTGRVPIAVEDKPEATDLAAWNRILRESGDADAGQRLFFSAQGARCGVCHQHGGRGGRIGPDLTRLYRSNTREQIIASILQPSREMAPRYQPWKLQTDAGETLLALRLHKAGDGGKEVYADSDGNQFQISGDEIDVRQASEVSIMPSGLEKTVSIDQLRDLVEFLATEN